MLPGKLPRLEPLTDSDLQSSFNVVDYAQEEVLIQDTGDNEDLCKRHLIAALLLSYRALNYLLEGLNPFCTMF
jgi:hypothetical protein